MYIWVLDWSFWITANSLCAVVIGVGLQKKYLDRFPMFFSYMAVSVFNTLVCATLLVLMEFFPRVSDVFDWFRPPCALLSFSIEMAAIYELWAKVVLPGSSLSKTLRPLPRWSAAAIFLFVTLLAAILPQTVEGRALQAYSTISISLNLMDLTWLIVLLLVSRVLGVSWPALPAGAALGIAISDAGCATGSILLNTGLHHSNVVQKGSALLAGAIYLTGTLAYARSEKVQSVRTQFSQEALAVGELVDLLRD